MAETKPEADGWHSDLDQRWSVLSGEVGKYQALLNRLFDLFDLHLAEALDLQQRLACGAVDGLVFVKGAIPQLLGMASYSNRVEAICLQLGDIGCSNAVGLDGVNVHDEVMLESH